MKRIFYIFIASCSCLVSCKKDKEDTTPSKADILTGGSEKGWKYTVNDSDAECPNTEKLHSDNTYTFYLNKKMMFDNGTVTEEGNCGDFANLEGTWAFSAKEDSLSLYGTRRLDNNVSLNGERFITGKITSISADKIVLSYLELSITFTPR